MWPASHQPIKSLIQQLNYFRQIPKMIRNPSFHRWRHPQGLVNPTEVVMHVMESESVFQVLNFLGKGVGQSSEPAHRHTHRQILTLDKTGRNVTAVGISANCSPNRASAFSGRISRLRSFSLQRIVELYQHRVINFSPESCVNSIEICAMPVCCQLNAACQPRFQFKHEVVSRRDVASPNVPRWDKFGVRIESNPCPNVSAAFNFLLNRAILFLGVNVRPNLVTLDSFARQIAKRFVLIFRAGASKITEKLHHSSAVNAGHSRNSSQGIALNQGRDNCLSFFGGQFVHADSMLERSSIVNTKLKNYFAFFQRDTAALRAIILRFLADNAAALALPPLSPPRRPNSTAAGFLLPVDSATMRAAVWFMSRCMNPLCLSAQGFATSQ